MLPVPESFETTAALLAAGAAAILLAGTRLAAVADRLADRTGLGEAFVGAVFLGATTSLPGITASVTAAWDGHPALAVSNAIGGIAAQTAFLAIADIAYRRANLEHAAASLGNLIWGAFLIVLLAVLLLGIVGPSLSAFDVHVVTPVTILLYLGGLRMVQKAREEPMWRPRMTHATRVDEPDTDAARRHSPTRLVAEFTVAAVLVAAAGWLVARAGESLVVHAGLSESLVGGLIVAVATSLPELITSVAAVRRGALTLAVGGILGGNTFDTLFVAMADVAYRDGPIHTAITSRETALVVLTIIMTAVLLLGLLWRQRLGPGRIGLESLLVLGLYAFGLFILSGPTTLYSI